MGLSSSTSMPDQSHTRNFAIIAHIDHGKSTLADRLLELTGTVEKRKMQEQILDSNPIERERGITIKLAPVRMEYSSLYSKKDELITMEGIRGQYLESRSDKSKTKIPNTKPYILNLIDTPGHVDFSYEVSRSLAACEGALLVVDATQGVQAQTLANLHQAQKHNLTIIPIINKIDLPNARIGETRAEIEALGFRKEEILEISAKTGENVGEVLEAIISRIPVPRGIPSGFLRALVFSSQYDAHKGVVVFVRIVDGLIPPLRVQPLKVVFMASGAEVLPIEIGYFSPDMRKSDGLLTGEVGYIATGLKDARMAKVGDTITESRYAISDKRYAGNKITSSAVTHNVSRITPLPGYQEPKPMVFLRLFPINSDDTTLAREAMERLRLSDSAFSFRPIHSLALGNGFHCGFLGLLHAEIVQERLSREFGLNMLATAPSVEYRIRLRPGVIPAKAGIQSSSGIRPREGGDRVRLAEASAKRVGDDNFTYIQSANDFPDPSLIDEVWEPIMSVVIYSPKQYVGAIMTLAQEKRGELIDQTYHMVGMSSWSGAIGSPRDAIDPSGLQHDALRSGQLTLTYHMPLSEMIVDFFDRLKSVTEGYASLDYEFFDYQPVKLVKVDVLVNKEKVDAFSFLTVEDQAQHRSRELVERLARAIPQQQFEIPVQAAIGGQVIARADVKSFRKDVTQKLYGGDRTRKDKLLEAQKKGKAKMKQIGRVSIPQEAFFQVLKRG